MAVPQRNQHYQKIFGESVQSADSPKCILKIGLYCGTVITVPYS